jgi:hypothetical protein
MYKKKKESMETFIKCGKAKYLSEVPDFEDGLPKNCIFHKGDTGVGGTHLALNDCYPTVVCVPFKNLIKNKLEQSSEFPNKYKHKLFGVHGGDNGESLEELKLALPNTIVPKILVTYDYLPRLNDVINTQEYNLVVDEYQSLLTEYGYRGEACDRVLDNFRRYKNFTFLSATPIPKEFLFNDLQNIKIVNAIWENKSLTSIVPIYTDNALKTLCKNIVRALNGEIIGNLYIFINSVEKVNKVILNCKLSPENTRILYSEYNDTTIENGIKRFKSTDEPVQFTFITKSGFQGCDINDINGKCIIVSDESRKHTLIDIDIQFPQIKGRIRNSKYSNIIYHIHCNTNLQTYSSLTYKELCENMDNDLNKAYKKLNDYHSYYDQDLKNQVHSCIKSNHTGDDYYSYMHIDEMGIPQINERGILASRYNYYILNNMYQSDESIENAYPKNQFTVGNRIFDNPQFDLLPMRKISGIDFAKQQIGEILRKYPDRKNIEIEDQLTIDDCFYQFPDLKKARIVLGEEFFLDGKKISSGGLKRMISVREIKLKTPSDYKRIAKYLHDNRIIETGKFYGINYIKSILQEAYSAFDVVAKPRSIDLELFFSVKSDSRYVNGVRTRGYIITCPKDYSKMAA